MRMIILCFTSFCLAGYLPAQQIKKDSGRCSCYSEMQLNYPDMPDSEKVEGTVIVEYELDSFCMARNPKVVKRLKDVAKKSKLPANRK